MTYSVLPISGINLDTTTPVEFAYTNGSTAESIPAFGPLGAETFGLMVAVMCLHKLVRQLLLLQLLAQLTQPLSSYWLCWHLSRPWHCIGIW